MSQFTFDPRKVSVNELVTREVHEHEVFLGFNSDEHATDFLEWLQVGGWEGFMQWLGEGKPS